MASSSPTGRLTMRTLSLWAASLVGLAAAADKLYVDDVDQFNKLAKEQKNRPHQTFRSSDVLGPVFNIATWDRSLTDNSSYIFLGTRYGEYDDYLGGPMILDASDLSLVYAGQEFKGGFSAEPYSVNGTQYLVFWDGLPGAGYALGNVLIIDQNYQIKWNVTSVGYSGADMHETALTQDGTALFTVYQEKDWDTSSVGGDSKGSIMDSGFQEVDLETNELIFEWFATDHFELTDSRREFYGKKFDFAHINSVEKTDDGNYLVSSRHMSSIFLVNGTDGDLIWIMGGPRNEFKDKSDGEALNFGWQHQARFLGDQDHITMFDNHERLTGPCDDKCVTRGLQLVVDHGEKSVRVEKEFKHPRKINTAAQGGMQILPNGNALLGFGYVPGYVEFTPDGEIALDIQRSRIDLDKSHGNGMNAYRVSKGSWVGRPSWPPSVAMDAPFGTVEDATLYISWNGATDIDHWAIYSSDDPESIKSTEHHIADFDRSGFETTAFLGRHHETRYVLAVAFNKDLEELGESLVMDMKVRQPWDISDVEESIGASHSDSTDGDHDTEDSKDSNGDDKQSTDGQSGKGTSGSSYVPADHSLLKFAGVLLILGSIVAVVVLWRRRAGSKLLRASPSYKALAKEERMARD